MAETTEITNKLIDKLVDRCAAATSGAVVDDIQEVLSSLTLEILLRNIFSIDIDEHEWGRDFTDATKACDEWVGKRIDKPLHLLSDFFYFRSEDARNFLQDSGFMNDVCRNVIKERQATIVAQGGVGSVSATGDDRLDLLDLLLTSVHQDGCALDDDEILAQSVTFMSAGFGTTTTALTATLYCLAQHQEYQDRCVAELESVAAGGELEWSNLNELKFLYACFQEATRLYPPVPGIARDLDEAIDIDGRVVPAGTTVIASIYGVHHNPDVYPDPEEFDPSRFDADKSTKRDPYSWLIFSAGPRNCIGQKFAEMESKIVLAKLLRRFRFTIAQGPSGPAHSPVWVPAVILKSINGVELEVRPR